MILGSLFTDSLFGKSPPGQYAGVQSEELGMAEILSGVSNFLGYSGCTFISKTRGIAIWFTFKKKS